MGKSLEIKAIITAIDKVTAPVRKISSSIRESLGKPFGNLTKQIGLGAVALSDWTWTATKAASLGGLALAAGAIAAGNAYLEMTGELDDLSNQLDFSVEALQELRYVAKMSGIEVGELDGALAAMSKSVGLARAGTGKLSGFLKKVSPQLLKQVVNAKSNAEAFDLIVAAIDRLPDANRRAALATAAFGGSGALLLRAMADGAEGVKKLREEAHLVGAVLSEDAVKGGASFGDTLDRLKTSIWGVFSGLMSGLLPVLQPVIDQMTVWVAVNREMLTLKFAEFVQDLTAAVKAIDWAAVVAGVKTFTTALIGAWDTIGGASGAVKILGGLLAIQLGKALAGLLPLVGAIAGAFKALALTMMANPILAVAALIVGAVALIIANWSDLEEFGAELWRTLKQLWADGAAFAIGRWNDLVYGITSGWDSILKAFDGFGEAWTKNWDSFGKGIAPITDGIVGIFRAAWDIIGGIVDKVMGGIDLVVGGAKTLAGAVGIDFGQPGAAGAPVGVPGGLRASGAPVPVPGADGAIAGQPARVEGGVVVRFENPPPGLRVDSANSSTPGLSLSTQVGRRTMATGGAF